MGKNNEIYHNSFTQQPNDITFNADKFSVTTDSLCIDFGGIAVMNFEKIDKLTFVEKGKKYVYIKEKE